jgi:hypothetical protein
MVKNGPAHPGEFLSADRGKFLKGENINLQEIIEKIKQRLEYRL